MLNICAKFHENRTTRNDFCQTAMLMNELMRSCPITILPARGNNILWKFTQLCANYAVAKCYRFCSVVMYVREYIGDCCVYLLSFCLLNL